MGFFLRRISDERYVLSEGVYVRLSEYAHIFESRKQAMTFISEFGFDPDDFEILENETDQDLVMMRMELIAAIKEDQDRWDDNGKI